MSSFDIAYLLTMSHEGSYSNDPNDRGGETWKGIARKMHPDWAGWQIVDAIKRQFRKDKLTVALNNVNRLERLVQLLYREIYWDKLYLDEISDQDVTNELFDTAVNQGSKTAVKYFQQALNLLNNNQKHYSDLKADGIIGNNTLKAYRAYMLTASFPSRSKQRNITTLLKAINFYQAERYVAICENNPAQEIYFYGWLNRV